MVRVASLTAAIEGMEESRKRHELSQKERMDKIEMKLEAIKEFLDESRGYRKQLSISTAEIKATLETQRIDLLRQFEEQKQKVSQLEAFRNQVRGGWFVVAILGASLGGAVVWLLGKIFKN
jgi:DNA-binding transcriptional MerR regulator